MVSRCVELLSARVALKMLPVVGGERHPLEQPKPVARISHEGRFRAANRLRSPRDFQRVRRHGRGVSGPLLALSCARRPTDEALLPPRIGFSVSKRVGGAVVRNRVKRRLRESIRCRIGELAPGWDIIISARADSAPAEYGALDAEVRWLLARAKLLSAKLDTKDERGER